MGGWAIDVSFNITVTWHGFEGRNTDIWRKGKKEASVAQNRLGDNI
jgi:hypothetical protein